MVKIPEVIMDKKPNRKKNKFSKNIFEKLQSKGGRGSAIRDGVVKKGARPLASGLSRKYRQINEDLN